MKIEKVIKEYPWSSKTIICNRESYLMEDFVLLVITHWKSANIAEVLGCSPSTVGRSLAKYIPELPKGPSVLGKKVLSLFELKKCNNCQDIKSYSDFSVCSREGYQSKCKKCKQDYYITKAESIKEQAKLYYKDDPDKYKRKAREYQMRKLNRTPPWADQQKIATMYETCPKGFHVDHIIPLQGEKVSGLHVHENLQHLPASENLSKGNKYDPSSTH